MLERIPNDAFFGAVRRGRRVPETIPAEAFYLGSRPATGPPLALRLARTPLRFGMTLFLVGWAGIIFQASFFQQVVFGAPVFEELAKLGPALVVVTVLGARSRWARLPYALLFGGAFGVFEHYLTYPTETTELFVGRIIFHGATAALSMTVYTLLESTRDPRARWVTTVPSTLLHWANNFAAVLFGVTSVFAPAATPVGLAWASFVTLLVVVSLLVSLLAPRLVRRSLLHGLAETVPRLELEQQRDGILAPPGRGS